MQKTILISSSAFGPNTPEWQLWAIGIFMLISIMVVVGWGYILEQKFTGPYTLLSASSRQKWKWAAIVVFWQTLMIPLLGLVQPILSPLPDQWPTFPLFCSGLWIGIYPIAVAYKRWGFERQVKSYKRLNTIIKAGGYRGLLSSRLLRWSRLLMNAERRRFFEEGYPQDEAVRWPLLELSQKLADNTNSVAKWFKRRYPGEQILYVSPMTVLEGEDGVHVGRSLRRVFQRRGIVIITRQLLLLKSKFLSLYTFVYLGIAIVLLSIALGIQYLLYPFYRELVNNRFGALLVLAIFLPSFFLLMWSAIFGLPVFQRRPYQEEIALHDIRDIEVSTYQGLTGKYASLIITAGEKTLNIVAVKTLPEDVIQVIRQYTDNRAVG